MPILIFSGAILLVYDSGAGRSDDGSGEVDAHPSVIHQVQVHCRTLHTTSLASGLPSRGHQAVLSLSVAAIQR